MLEDGLQADVYYYEWREIPDPLEVNPAGGFFDEPLGRSRHRVRMLTGPRESVYLRYAMIDAVEAHSWPLWAGVEIQVAGLSGRDSDGPLVIRAADAEEAVRLTDAIDCLRRARDPDSTAATEPALPVPSTD